MCKHMKALETQFYFLKYEKLERIKSAVCGACCGGVCRQEFMEDKSIDKKNV